MWRKDEYMRLRVLGSIRDIDELLEHLDKVRPVAGKQEWRARCPSHEDRKPSLSVGLSGDKILLHCHAGCTPESIVQALGYRMCDLFIAPTTDHTLSAQRTLRQVYPYYDADGLLRYEVLRYEWEEDGRIEKDFRQRRPDGKGGYAWNMDGIERILYRLPEVAASRGTAPVFFCEGEKDCDTLSAAGLLATTLTGGSDSKWHDGYATYLAGKEVVILPDNDEAGERYADRIAQGLYGKAKSIHFLRLPQLPPKGDISDWLQSDHSVDDLLRLIEQSDVYDPDKTSRYTLHWAREALLAQPEWPYAIKGIFDVGCVTLVYGYEGTFKTYCLLDGGIAVALGETWLDYPVTQGPVLLIDEESGRFRINRRLGHLMRAHEADASLPFAYVTLEGFNLRKEEDVETIREIVTRVRPRFIILDALADVMLGGDENTVKDTQPIFHALRQIAEKYQCAVAVIHHMNKTGRYRGSSAIAGAVDGMLEVERDEKQPVVTFTSKKARDAEPFKFTVKLMFQEDAIYLYSDTAPQKVKKHSKGQEYVLRYLGKSGPSLKKDISTHADMCSPNTAIKELYNLVSLGMVERVDKNGNGTAGLYALTKEGRLEVLHRWPEPETSEDF